MAVNYDSFSHWLLVIRDMLISDKLPGFHSPLITFQAYPTGAAGFIYYVCQIIGDFEHALLTGQGIMLASCLCVFWAFPKKQLTAGILITLASVYLLAANIPITEFLVDSLLALVAIAAFSMIWYYSEDLKKAAICNAVMGAFLILVKNSGIFFLIIHALFPIFLSLARNPRQVRQAFSKKNLWFLVISLSLPLILWGLWRYHVNTSFVYGDTSKHSMSLKNYYYMLIRKDLPSILSTLKAFFLRLIKPTLEIPPFLSIFCIYAAGYYAETQAPSNSPSAALPLLSWSVLSYVLYILGLMGMYIFSMHTHEAIALGSFDRYLATMTMYLVGVSLLFLLRILSRRMFILCAAILCFLLASIRTSIPALFAEPDRTYTLRPQLLEIKEEYKIPTGSSCFIFTEHSRGALYFMAAYEFWNSDIKARESIDPDEFQDIINNYDYFILMHQNDEVSAILSAHGLPVGQTVYQLEQYR